MRVSTGHLGTVIEVGSEALYWLEAPARGGSRTLRISPFSKGGAALAVSVSAESCGVAASSTEIFVHDYDRVERYSLAGGPLGTVFEASGGVITALAHAGESIYVAIDEKEVRRVSVSDGTTKTLVRDGTPIGEFVVQGEHLYWVALSQGELRRVPLSGGEAEVLYEGELEHPLSVLPGSIVVVENHFPRAPAIVWVDPQTLRVSTPLEMHDGDNVRGLVSAGGEVFAHVRSKEGGGSDWIAPVEPGGIGNPVAGVGELRLPETNASPVLHWLDSASREIQRYPAL